MSAISALREQVGAYALGFDASACTVEQCEEVLAEATVIERMAATMKAQAASRVAACGSWRSAGGRSAAHDLAAKTGTTVGAARETLLTGPL